jgi:hypothetical protein
VLASVFDKSPSGRFAARVRAWCARIRVPRAHALRCPVCDIWDDV